MSDSLPKEYFAFTWKIKNFSYWVMKKDESLDSLPFITVKTENIKWVLQLFPYIKNRKQFEVRILRERHGDQTFTPMSMASELSILDDNDAVLQNRYVKYANHTENPLCADHFAQRSKLFFRRNTSFFPGDTLTILCKIWHEDIVPGQYSNTLVFYRENIFWNIGRFKDSLTNSKEFQLGLNHFILVLKRCHSCHYHTRSLKIFQDQGEEVAFDYFRISFYDFFRNCFIVLFDEVHLDEKNGVQINLPQNFIANDSLSLQVEYTIGCDIVEEQHSSSFPAISENENIANPAETDVPESSLRGDMLRLYEDGKFCDATLRSGGKSFHVHKNVICARSPVFCAMFEGDTTEARLGVVDIPDVDPDTVENMLLFLYKDTLEDSGWEEASRMYYAADKYAILPLKEKCLSILKTELSVHNACDALVLADTHQDEGLMESVKEFICGHDEVIQSSEWKELEDGHPRLTIQIFREMHLMKEKK